MSKNIETIFKEFQNELKENDKKVKAEINKKQPSEKLKEFAEFIETNKCKTFKGGKRVK